MGRSFFDQAREIRRGQFLEDCADELEKVVAAVDETGKVAKLVITLTVKPASKGQGAIVLTDKVKAQLPELPVGETILFVTNENSLVANDPRQKEMELRSISTPAPVVGELKTVNG